MRCRGNAHAIAKTRLASVKGVQLTSERVPIDGIALLPCATERPGRLLVRLGDASLAGRALRLGLRAPYCACAAGRRRARDCVPPGHLANGHSRPPLSASARRLFNDGTDLRAGDYTTTERCNCQASHQLMALRLVRIKGSYTH